MGSGEPLFSEQRLSIYVDEEVPCLVNEWNGFVPSDQFRKYILTLLDVFKEIHQRYEHLTVLADTRKLEAIAPSDIDWVSKNVNHEYVSRGCHYEAFIVPEDVFGQAAVKRYVKESTSAGMFVTKMFDKAADAKSWLKEVRAVVPT